MEEDGEKARGAIFRDIRRYYCEFCGLCRSKKSLISSHILAHHKEEIKEMEENKEKVNKEKQNTCEDCGASFRKLAHLKQHMQSHSLEIEVWCNIILNGLVPGGGPPEKLHQVSLCHAERPFKCPLQDCQSSYRRKDHLNRHMLQHQGKLFECPVEDCKHRFTIQGNMKRHIEEFHDECAYEKPKEYVCAELGCGKVFKYPSKLRKHEDSHVKLDSVEALCSEPGCMKYFTTEQCLKEHIRSCHQYIVCDECGIKQLKKNIKRHLRVHETGVSSDRIKCSFKGCPLKFSNMSNRNHHIKAVHLELKPYTCSKLGCRKKFAYKHVRDNHEKSGCHIYIPGNFEESDEQFRSRPRGGRKRKYPVIETLMRKRVILNEGPEFLARLLSGESEH